MPDRDHHVCELERLIGPVADRAGKADQANGDLRPDIADLSSLGWLKACLPRDHGGKGWGTEREGAIPALNALRALGRANLSVARLFEGHMNAVQLIFRYGNLQLKNTIARDICGADILLGVWGADDPAHPFRFRKEDNAIRLGGAKRFASGLGLVDKAIVIAPGPGGEPSMLVVPVDDEMRGDSSGWNMAGMRATRSGRYEFEGLLATGETIVGDEGDYLREPHFEGGIWRYCATHLGGAEALYREMLKSLTARNRADDTDQRRRIVACATALETSRLWLVRCAEETATNDAEPSKATLSLLARQVTETACRDTIEIVDRALGMAAHEENSPVERIKRDLSLFLCQAAPDAKRERAGRALVRERQLAEML